MIVENIKVHNLEEALTGAGLPFSKGQPPEARLVALANSQSRSHAKFLRQILISCDITGSGYWWKEMDTYKVGTVRMSTSTMHKLMDTNLTLDDFEIAENLTGNFRFEVEERVKEIIRSINEVKALIMFEEDSKTKTLMAIKTLLPESFKYKSHFTFNYESLRTMYADRITHRVPEWKAFLNSFKDIPYFNEFIVK